MIAKASTTVTSRLIQVDSGTERDGLSTLIESRETFVSPQNKSWKLVLGENQ